MKFWSLVCHLAPFYPEWIQVSVRNICSDKRPGLGTPPLQSEKRTIFHSFKRNQNLPSLVSMWPSFSADWLHRLQLRLTVWCCPCEEPRIRLWRNGGIEPRILSFVARWMLDLIIGDLVGKRDGLEKMSNRASYVYCRRKYSMDGLTD